MVNKKIADIRKMLEERIQKHTDMMEAAQEAEADRIYSNAVKRRRIYTYALDMLDDIVKAIEYTK